MLATEVVTIHAAWAAFIIALLGALTLIIPSAALLIAGKIKSQIAAIRENSAATAQQTAVVGANNAATSDLSTKVDARVQQEAVNPPPTPQERYAGLAKLDAIHDAAREHDAKSEERAKRADALLTRIAVAMEKDAKAKGRRR